MSEFERLQLSLSAAILAGINLQLRIRTDEVEAEISEHLKTSDGIIENVSHAIHGDSDDDRRAVAFAIS